MAENKSGSKSKKTPKRDKYYEPGFFNDYGGSGITVTYKPNNTQKSKKKK